MKFKDSKILFLVFCCILLLVSVGCINASDTNGSDITDKIVSDTNSNLHNISSENIQTTKNIKKIEAIQKTGNETKSINKVQNIKNNNINTNQNKNIKKAEVPYNVNDFNSLRTTWEQIQNSGSTSDSYIINLAEGTYIFTSSLNSTSTLHLNITINGQNPANTIFNGEGNVKFFNIQGQDISLNNITFSNGYVQEDQGGAISFTQGNLIMTNSTFINNTVASIGESTTYQEISGGALYAANFTTVRLINDTFTNNHAEGTNNTFGGAVAFMGTGNPTIENCTFTNNYVSSEQTSYAGAIYAIPGINIVNSNFTNNSVRSYESAYGGAIVIYRTSNIINSNFINNLADGSDGNAAEAGAIYHLGDTLTIRNSTFNNNEAKGKDATFGGAISDYTSMLYIYDSTFNNNKVESSSNSSYGGALSLQSTNLVSTNTNYDNNTAVGEVDTYGGAIYSNYEIEINNNTFTNNKANSTKNTYGGAISSVTPVYMQVQVTIRNSRLNNNTANSMTTSNGGAVSITGSNIAITNTIFENNTVNATTTSYGGAIETNLLDTMQPTLNMNNVTFNNNLATSTTTSYGGAIATTATNTIANNTKFTNNKAESKSYSSYGGALSTTGESETIRSNIILNNTKFTNNTIDANTKGYGGAISITASDLMVNNTNFTNNNVNSIQSNSYGGAIATTGQSITHGSIVNINNVNFTNNTAKSENHYSYGGAIAITGSNITLNNTQFNKNVANSTSYGSYGGAIATTGESETRNSNMTIINNTFTNNIATGNVRNYGGAISTTGSNINITRSRFENNTVNSRISNSYGGAIATTGESETRNSNVTITDTIFHKNMAISSERSYGGAISITGSNINLRNTNFTNNTANSNKSNSYGGALATTGESTVFSATININDSNFENNTAVGYSKTYGGAIATTGANIQINNNIFTNNIANSTRGNSYGGALATTGESETRNSNITIADTEFKNNTATALVKSYGGAISTLGSSLSIDTTNFTQNKALAVTDNSYGGAISTVSESEIQNSNVTITNTNFTNNTLNSRIRSYGGAISGINQNLKVNLTSFTNNTATSELKGYGGAISIISESTIQGSTLDISNVTFTNNKVNGSALSYGGAVAITGANFTLTNTTLENNTATSTNTSYGGAIATTGESEIKNSNLTISYCSFLSNTAKIGGGIYGKNNILNLTFCAFNNNTAEGSVNLKDENVTLILRGNYFAQTDSIYDSNITAQVNSVNAVALLNQTTTSPIRVVLVEKDSNKTIEKLGNNYMLDVTSIPEDLVSKVTLSVDNGYSQDVEFKSLPDDSNMKMYAEYTLIAIMNHDANLTLNITTPVNTVGNVTANVTVTENGKPVNGTIIFKVDNETFNVTVVDGVAQLNYTLPENITMGEHNIYAELINPIYNPNNITGVFNVVKLDIANTTINDVIKTLENYTISTIVKDTNGNTLVGENKIAVKINGVTFIRTTIKDGVLNVTLPTDAMNAQVYNITVIIGENNLYNTGGILGNLTIVNRNVTVKVDVNSSYTLSDLLANVTVTEDGKLLKDGVVIFKINGLTLKNANGNPIMVNVVDGHAYLNYTLSQKYSAYPSSNNGVYNFTAVYSNNYYNTNDDVANFTLKIKEIPNATLDSVDVLTGENTTINITVHDANGNPIVGNKKIAVKLNGKTIMHENITNGRIYLTIPTDKLRNGEYNIVIIIGSNCLYSNATYNMQINIQKGNASVKTDAFSNGKTLSLRSQISTDELNGSFVDNGVVIYKLNGVTLKDENGNVIKVAVRNASASLDYKLPGTITATEYNLTSVYSNTLYYNNCECVENITVPRIAIPNIVFNNTEIAKNKNLTINTTLNDIYNDTLCGVCHADIKINGKVVMKTSIVNGRLNVTIPTSNLKAGSYEVIIIIHESAKYLSAVDLMNLEVLA